MAPCFKKGDKEEKENYRPISILSDFSKVFERLIKYRLQNIVLSSLQLFSWASY